MAIRRLAAILLAVVAAGGGAVAIVAFLDARDDARVAPTSGPGRAYPDRCAEHGAPDDSPSSEPPTSGTHRAHLIPRDGRRVTDDQLLHALELGNVVLAYDAERPPAALRALQEELSGPFDAELAAAGQAVVLARRDDADGIVALAWRHAQQASSARDPALRAFAEHWLGRGYAGARGENCPPPG